MKQKIFSDVERTQLFKTLVFLSLPTVIEQILSTLLQYVDTAMVGRLGEQATASVSITTNVTWLVNSAPAAIGTAALVLISKAYGAQDLGLVKKLLNQAFILASAAGVILGAVSILLSPFIPVWMGAEEAVCPQASRYFFIISLPLIFRSLATVMGYTLRAVRNTKTPMIISAVSNGINIALNYILIYLIDLGVDGAAVASAVSYTVSGILMLNACRKNECFRFKLKSTHLDKTILKEYLKLGAPVFGSSAVSCLGYVVFASLVSGMGTTVFAAHSIAVTAETIFYVPGYGLRSAASTLIGNARGEQNSLKLRETGKLSVALTIAVMCVSGIVLYFGSTLLMSLFSPSERVIELGSQMLKIVAFSEPFFGLMVVLEGIFYGLGRTKYAFFVESVGMWCVRILFTFLCVRVWGMGLNAVWYCMIADNICKALMFAFPFMLKSKREKLLKI